MMGVWKVSASVCLALFLASCASSAVASTVVLRGRTLSISAGQDDPVSVPMPLIPGTASISGSVADGFSIGRAGSFGPMALPPFATALQSGILMSVSGSIGGGGFFGAGLGPGGGVGGTQSLSGLLSIQFPGGIVPVTMPFLAGAAGTVSTTHTGLAFQVEGRPWTTGAAVVTGVFSGTVTRMGVPIHLLSSKTTEGITASHTSLVRKFSMTLVSPVRVSYVFGSFPMFVSQELQIWEYTDFLEFPPTFVPEPGTAILLAASAACVVAGGRVRRR